MNAITTNFVYPPVPYRDQDWSATVDGYEPGEAIGRGATERAAIADLLEQLEEDDLPLPSRQLLQPRRFNDDDLYVFNPDTLQLVDVIAVSNRRGYRCPEGLCARIGLTAKSLGLWTPVQPTKEKQ